MPPGTLFVSDSLPPHHRLYELDCTEIHTQCLDHCKPPASADIFKEFGTEASFIQGSCPLLTCLTVTSGYTDAKLERAAIISRGGRKVVTCNHYHSPITGINNRENHFVLSWQLRGCARCVCVSLFFASWTWASLMSGCIHRLKMISIRRQREGFKNGSLQMRTAQVLVLFSQKPNTIAIVWPARQCREVHCKERHMTTASLAGAPYPEATHEQELSDSVPVKRMWMCLAFSQL